jgi:hypothetical protein
MGTRYEIEERWNQFVRWTPVLRDPQWEILCLVTYSLNIYMRISSPNFTQRDKGTG